MLFLLSYEVPFPAETLYSFDMDVKKEGKKEERKERKTERKKGEEGGRKEGKKKEEALNCSHP